MSLKCLKIQVSGDLAQIININKIYEPFHEILVLIATGQTAPVEVHANVASGARVLKFGPNLQYLRRHVLASCI